MTIIKQCLIHSFAPFRVDASLFLHRINTRHHWFCCLLFELCSLPIGNALASISVSGFLRGLYVNKEDTFNDPGFRTVIDRTDDSISK